VSPYDLIKKYVAESSPPNSLSDSHLSSDGGGGGGKECGGGNPREFIGRSESEEFTDSDEDDLAAMTAAAAAAVGIDNCRGVQARFNNSFRISGQKIQIYSDCSAIEHGGGGRTGNYSLSSSSSERDGDDEEDNDADDDDDDDEDDDVNGGDHDSCYDADVSVLESPRVRSKLSPPPIPPPPLPPPPPAVMAPPPCKPPRRKSSEKELKPTPRTHAAVPAASLPQLQLQIINLNKTAAVGAAAEGVSVIESYQRRTATLPRSGAVADKPRVSRQTSAESRGGSVTSRSRSFASSRESLLFGISKNFSSEVMRELYGSKTSLLQHLDQEQQQQRRQRLSDPAAAAGRVVVSIVDGDGGEAATAPAPPTPSESSETGERNCIF
jgi:hypothetical protein